MPTSYRDFLGIAIRHDDAYGRMATMPASDRSGGAHAKLHGGSIAALLEQVSADRMRLAIDGDAAFAPVDVTIDYLRGGAMVETRAAAVVQRLGGRVANVLATAWQDDPDTPIAVARTIYLIHR